MVDLIRWIERNGVTLHNVTTLDIIIITYCVEWTILLG